MISKTEEKVKAIELRKQGFSYSEILKEIPVAKSSLSLWLRSVGLSKRVTHILTEKKRLSALRGAVARHNQRIVLTSRIFKETEADIQNISKRELWLMGVMLYWAEGSKEKDHSPGSGVVFGNSDCQMINLFLKWLLEITEVKKENIGFEIYIHENSKNSLERVRKFWADSTGFGIENFNKIYFKRNKIKTNRTNIGTLYYGLLRVKVKRSSTLTRKIAGWVNAINKAIKLPGGVFGNTLAFEARDTRFEP